MLEFLLICQLQGHVDLDIHNTGASDYARFCREQLPADAPGNNLDSYSVPVVHEASATVDSPVETEPERPSWVPSGAYCGGTLMMHTYWRPTYYGIPFGPKIPHKLRPGPVRLEAGIMRHWRGGMASDCMVFMTPCAGHPEDYCFVSSGYGPRGYTEDMHQTVDRYPLYRFWFLP
jgi:hypothetical protein